MLQKIQAANFLSLPPDQAILISSIPVLFTSFGFHGSIPSLVRHLENDSQQLRLVMIIGSLPLFIYLAWHLANIGIMSESDIQALKQHGSRLSSMVEILQASLRGQYDASAFTIFANLALTTSFLGVTLGLFDYLIDLLGLKRNRNGRLSSVLLTFGRHYYLLFYNPKALLLPYDMRLFR